MGKDSYRFHQIPEATERTLALNITVAGEFATCLRTRRESGRTANGPGTIYPHVLKAKPPRWAPGRSIGVALVRREFLCCPGNSVQYHHSFPIRQKKSWVDSGSESLPSE